MLHTDHYQTLGLTHDATQEEIKQAYRRLAKQYHPDRSEDNNSHEKIIAINVAYEVVKQSAAESLLRSRLCPETDETQSKSATPALPSTATTTPCQSSDESVD